MTKVFRCAMTSGLICCLVIGLVLLNSKGALGKDKKNSATNQVVRLGRSFTLRAGREVTLKGSRLRIKFAAVDEDSRCPSDVTCVWAGNAAARLEVSTSGKDSQSLTLNTSTGSAFGMEKVYDGYKLWLVRLTPYPRSTKKIAASDYIATLVVTKERPTSKN
jgi:hypothetical protein